MYTDGVYTTERNIILYRFQFHFEVFNTLVIINRIYRKSKHTIKLFSPFYIFDNLCFLTSISSSIKFALKSVFSKSPIFVLPFYGFSVYFQE